MTRSRALRRTTFQTRLQRSTTRSVRPPAFSSPKPRSQPRRGMRYIRHAGNPPQPAQVAGWRKITGQPYNRAGGTIFAQLWHVGRVSHPPDFHRRGGCRLLLPALTGRSARAFRSNGKVRSVTPRALEAREVARGRLTKFPMAAENAKAPGSTAIELHGAIWIPV